MLNFTHYPKNAMSVFCRYVILDTLHQPIGNTLTFVIHSYQIWQPGTQCSIKPNYRQRCTADSSNLKTHYVR